MPYVNCPNCGQKALTVASRCPQCGLAFENQFSQSQELGARQPRRKRGLFIAAAVVAVLVMEAVLRGPGTPAPTRLPSTAVESPPPPKAAATPKPTEPGAETVRAAPPPPAAQPKVEPPPPIKGSTGLAAPTPAPAPVTAPETGAATGATVRPGTQRLYANIWVNVRSERSNSSTVIQILRPGQVVLVDTLIQGWYRIVAGDKAVGYVDKHFLQASPPPDAP